MFTQICAQVPSAAAVLARLGMFYYWHVWLPIPQTRVFCHVPHAMEVRGAAFAWAGVLLSVAYKLHL